MAVKVITYYITSGLGGGGLYLTGQYIRVMVDGPTITAELWDDDEDGSLISIPSGGPDISTEITVSGSSFNDYQYCDSADLVYYTLKNTWPYADYHTSVGHPSCVIVVCDLEITGYTGTNETTVGAVDGEVALTATSSNGTVKFSLVEDFVYASGQDSPITGLATGSYVVYAKDPAGCTDQILVFVGIDYVYGVRWRCDYDNVIPGHLSRIDIEERDYVGAITETFAGEEPFQLEYIEEEDSQIVHSNVIIQFLVERGEEGKFEDIRIGFDRQFVVRKYKNTVLEWVGYITPEFYEEPYLGEPYVITFKAIDGLKELQSKPFVQLSGEPFFGPMSSIGMIAECLKKLPVQLNIRSCVNLYEVDMDQTAADDPLEQAYMKSENLKDDTCYEMITKLIKPFTRAQLFQSLGVYWIRTKEQSVYTTLPYREFDKDGVFVSNSSIAARKPLDGPRVGNCFYFGEQSQRLLHTRPFGTFKITHELDKDNNMIDSGGFELDDIDPATEFFRTWHLFPLQANVSAGLEYVDNGESKAAFFFSFSDSGAQQLNSLVSDAMPINITGNVFENKLTSFKLKFQVYEAPRFKVDWVWLGWKLRFVDTDTGDFWDWFPPSTVLSSTPDLNEARINDVYVTEFNSWKTYEYYGFRFPGDIAALNFTVQLSFYFHNHQGRDFSGYASFKAEPTVDFDEGKRFYIADAAALPTGTNDNTYGYELRHSVEAESIPDIVEPDDYAAITNEKKWYKIAEYGPDGNVPMIDRIMFDNVVISLFTIDPILDGPGVRLIDPPPIATYEQTVSDRNESVFEDTVYSGDSPQLTGADYIYNGFFKLSDGTLTDKWARQGVTEESPLLAIYLAHLVAQGSRSLRRLVGSGYADIQLAFINSLEDQRDDKRYRFTRFVMYDKTGKFDIETEEVLTGADGESPPDPDAITFDSTIHKMDEELTFDMA